MHNNKAPNKDFRNLHGKIIINICALYIHLCYKCRNNQIPFNK